MSTADILSTSMSLSNNGSTIGLYQDDFGNFTTEQTVESGSDTRIDITLSALGICINFVGLILDVFCIVLIACRTSSWSKQLVLIMNILVCDSLISVSGFLMQAVAMKYVFHLESPNGFSLEFYDQVSRRLSCTDHVLKILWDIGTNANLFGLLLMTLDHLVAVRWSLKHATVITKTWIFVGVSIAWMVSVVLGLYPVFAVMNTEHAQMVNWESKGTSYFCYKFIVYSYTIDGEYYFEFNQSSDILTQSSLSISLILLLLVVMIAIYSYIACVIIGVTNRKLQQHAQINGGARGVHTTERILQQRKKGVVTSVMFVVSFSVVWLPLVIFYLVSHFYANMRNEHIEYIGDSLTLLASTTVLIDVAIYVARNKDVRRMALSTIRRRIQAMNSRSKTYSTNVKHSSASLPGNSNN